MPRGLIAGMGVLLVFAALMLTFAPGGAGSSAIIGLGQPAGRRADRRSDDGSGVTDFVNWVGLFGLIASFFSIIFAYSRQLFALSRAGYFPRFLSVTSGRKVPWLALLVPGRSSASCSRPFWEPRGRAILNIAVFGAAVSYVLMMLSHIVLRSREPDLERGVPHAGRHARRRAWRSCSPSLAVVATFLVDTTAAFITLGVYVAAAAVLRPLLAPPPRRLGARGGVRGDRERRGRAGRH